MANSLDDMMVQMANQAYQLDNARLAQLQQGKIGDSLPGVRSFADVWQAINMVRDTMNGLRDNRRLRAQQEYLDNDNNQGQPQQQQPLSFSGQGWSVGQLAPNGQDWKQNSFSSLFGGQNPNWQQSLPNGEGDNPYSFTEPTSEQAQRSVGEVPQSATLDDSLKDSFNLSDYIVKQPQTQVQPQTQPYVQPQMGRPQGNIDYLSDDYAMHNWVQNNGGGKPYLDMMKYAMNFAPLRESARQERIRNNIGIYENPESTPEQKQQARIQLSSDLGQLDLGYDLQAKRDKDNWTKLGHIMTAAAQAGYDPMAVLGGLGGNFSLDGLQGLFGQDDEDNTTPQTDYSGSGFEGKSWVRNNDGVDLSNAKPNTITGLNHISDIFQKTTGKPLIVTSGNDSNIHAGGEFSHGNGWKVDVSGNGLEDPKIRYPFIKQCESLGITVRDEYDNPSPNSTGGHLDLTFNGYKGNVRKKKNGFGSALGRGLPLSPKEYARRQKEALAERREAKREALEDAKFKLQVARFNAKYGDGVKEKGKKKGLSEQDMEQAIYDYADAEAPTIKQGHAIGEAWAEDVTDYVKEYGKEDGLLQIYYDLAAMSPEERGWSMSSEKLAGAIGYAFAHAAGQDGKRASDTAKRVAKFLLSGGTSKESLTEPTKTTDPSKATLKEADQRRLDGAVGDLTDDSEGVYVTTDAYGKPTKVKERDYKTKQILLGKNKFNPRRVEDEKGRVGMSKWYFFE